MNLHAIVAPYVGAVNPMQMVTVRVSAGTVSGANGIRAPLYETPGSLVASIAAGLLTVSQMTSGVLKPAQTVVGPGVAPNTLVVQQVSGQVGGAGVYTLNQVQAAGVSSEVMSTLLQLPAQVQPMTMRDLVQIEGLNLNGEKRAIYLNGDIEGIVRIDLKGGDLITTRDGKTWLIVQNLEAFADTSGWSKCAMVLQDGS